MYSRFADDHPSGCDKHAIESNKVIAGYGENIICPECMSTARERLVLAMLDDLRLHNGKVLHLSPEKHVYARLKKDNDVITADLIPGFYRVIDNNIQSADATALKFDNGQFDLVVANHIMEHIPDDRKALKEIYRVLKPGGSAILQVPYSEMLSATIEDLSINDPVLQSKLYGQKDHVRIYALNDYIQRLSDAGFIVNKISYESLSDHYKYAIQQNECFLEIRKPTS
jgi:SAM-dependent methyltransferase